ncbi:MAG: DNA gyrase subunit A [Promethearchaeia archaeon]|nr:MAG: DNA gyrase subunit A [Candidatus Lokiarchaeia archaeon]
MTETPNPSASNPAPSNPNPPPSPSQNQHLIIDRDLKQELSKSYIDYAMSVIIGRAIPDVRDGLKPVQRRILYSMAQNNFFYNRPHFKSARIVGDCLGKYHPHGDQSVYQAMVRLAQDFSVRYQLIDGQGNFGSVDGDSAAAMRYTEARLAKISNEMLQDIDKNTVDFQDNFDGSLQEPVFLPAKLPLILLNGASGIAVGMSTNIAPHNLNEIGEVICHAIDIDPENLSTQDILKFVKGPDFPTGGLILGRKGFIDAVETGRGQIVTRGRCEIISEGAGRNKDSIVITEIPYMVNKSRLIESIAALVNKGAIPEISDIRDESDRTGMRIVIELKQNSDANACLNRLYLRTQLQTTFGIINLMLVNKGKQPKILNYVEIIQEFIQHREQIIIRRTQFELTKAKKRLHLIEGLLKAIDNIDEIVAIIKKSSTTQDAAAKLQTRFQFSDLQVQEILKMPLSRLTNLQTQKLVDEKANLQNKIKEYEEILAHQPKRYEIIKQETLSLMKEYGDPRKSEIVMNVGDISIEQRETEPEEECVIIITQNQKIKRMTLQNYQAQGRGGKGKRGMKIREEDIVKEMFTASSHDTILLFTQKGRVYSIPAFSIPKSSRNSQGKAIVNYVQLQSDEKIIDIANIPTFDESSFLVFSTAKGLVKKTDLKSFEKIRKTGIRCMSILEGDSLVCAKYCPPGKNILMATKKGYAIRFIENEIRSMGRTARGVRGVTLRPDDEVIDFIIADEDSAVVSITKQGYGKHSKLDLYRLTHRGGKGVINMKLRNDADEVVAVKAIPSNKNLLLASNKGIIIRIRTDDIRETGRATQGVIVMRLDDDDSVSSVALCDPEESEENC